MQKSRPSGVCRKESLRKYRRFREKKDAQSIIDEYGQDEEDGQQPEEKPEQKEAGKYRGRGRKRKEQQKNKQKQAAQISEKPKTAEDMMNILLGRKADKKTKKKQEKDKKKKKKLVYRQNPFHKELLGRIRCWKDSRRVTIEKDDTKKDDKKDTKTEDKDNA